MSSKVFRDVREEVLFDGVTITETVNSSAKTAQNVESAVFFLTIASWATLTSIDVKLQAQDPKTLAWFDLGIAFAQATGNTSEMLNNILVDTTNNLAYLIPLGKFIRAVATVVGSGSAVVTLSMVGKS